MSRYERGQYFEALCGLRDAYTARSDDDRRSSLLVDDAIVYAEAVMRALDEKESAAEVRRRRGHPVRDRTLTAGEN